MSNRASSIKSGLAWIVVSPIALLMALISTVESLNVYYVQIFCFGAWSAFGVVSGITRIVGAPWTNRLQSILSWIGFIFFWGRVGYGALFNRGIVRAGYCSGRTITINFNYGSSYWFTFLSHGKKA